MTYPLFLSALPTQSRAELYHVGFMRIEARQPRSYEGHAGLSVSTHPAAWIKIAKLGGRPLNHLYKTNALFLDAHAITESQWQLIYDWAVEAGYLLPHTYWAYECDDEHGDGPVRFQFLLQSEAICESDGAYPVFPTAGYVGTEAFTDKVGAAQQFDASLILTILAEFSPELDGVLWEDALDIPGGSAPRALILNSRLNTWKTTDITEQSEMDMRKFTVDKDRLKVDVGFNLQSEAARQVLQTMPELVAQMAHDLLHYESTRERVLPVLIQALEPLVCGATPPDDLYATKKLSELVAGLKQQWELAHSIRALQLSIEGWCQESHDWSGLRAYCATVTLSWPEGILVFKSDFEHSRENGFSEQSSSITLNGDDLAAQLGDDDSPFPELPLSDVLWTWLSTQMTPGDPDLGNPYAPERRCVLNAVSLMVAHSLFSK